MVMVTAIKSQTSMLTESAEQILQLMRTGAEIAIPVSPLAEDRYVLIQSGRSIQEVSDKDFNELLKAGAIQEKRPIDNIVKCYGLTSGAPPAIIAHIDRPRPPSRTAALHRNPYKKPW